MLFYRFIFFIMIICSCALEKASVSGSGDITVSRNQDFKKEEPPSALVSLPKTNESALLNLQEGGSYDFGVKYFLTDARFTIFNSGKRKATNIDVTGTVASFQFKGGSFPGIGGTCGKELEAGTTCTFVISYQPGALQNSLTQVESVSLQISYFNGVQSVSNSLILRGGGDIAHQKITATPRLRKANAYYGMNSFYCTGNTFENFGSRVIAALDDVVVVGAPCEDAEVGSNLITAGGSVYIYSRQIGTTAWSLQQTLTSPNAANAKNFGSSVAISKNLLVIGEQNSTVSGLANNGQVFIYSFDQSKWNFLGELTVPVNQAGRRFGASVAINGNWIAVGAPGDSSTQTYGAPTLSQAGAVYLYLSQNGQYQYNSPQKITSNNRSVNARFGTALAINPQLGQLAVGAPYETAGANTGAGTVYLFGFSGATWSFLRTFVSTDASQASTADTSARTTNDNFGASVAFGKNLLVIGAPGIQFDEKGTAPLTRAGAVYVYNFTSSIWRILKKIVATGVISANERVANVNFGESVSINSSYILVGAIGQPYNDKSLDFLTGAGAAYLFNSGQTSQEISFLQKVIPKGNNERNINDRFGSQCFLSEKLAIISSANSYDFKGDSQQLNAGAIYIYE